MNTRHYYLRLLRTLALAALTAAATAACSDDTDNDREPLTPPDGNDGIPVSFTANINPGSDADPDTRTVLDSDGNGGFTVTWKGRNDNPTSGYDRIYIWAAQGTTTTGFKIYVPTTSGASSVLEPRDDSEKLTLPLSGEWKFTAAYGQYSSGNSKATAMVSPLTQSAPGNTNDIARWDFSVATAEQNILDAGSEMPAVINFKFEHKLSALQLRITNQTGEELTIKEIRLFADGGQIAYQRDYDVATGKWKTTGEKKADYLKLTASNFPALATGGASQDFHMLFFPGYENETLTVTVITSRGEYSRTRRAPDGGFLAGKNYLTDITIKSSGLDPDKETWTETISTAEELAAFRNRVNAGNNYAGATVRLLNDITLSGTWTPIGNEPPNSFDGTFDGGGHLISGLNVDVTDRAGLFGIVSGGTVRNLCVSGNVKTTGNGVGGIVGFLSSNSTVENCIFDGTVSGNIHVGGIVGLSSENSRIAGCHTKGKVTATEEKAGGIAGGNASNSTITDCYSEAEAVSTTHSAGGIVGYNSSTITRCYTTGQVSGKETVGGIVGLQADGGTVTDCIALNPGLERTTEDSYTTFGRIMGRKAYNSIVTITNCAAFDGMTIKDVNTTDFSADATGEHGAALTADDCLTGADYISCGMSADNGWAFDAAGPWLYLPYRNAFSTFPGLTNPDDYRIKVPDHLKAPAIP